MKIIILLVFFIPTICFSLDSQLSPEIKERLDAFSKPLKSEYAKFSVEKGWSELQIEDKGVEKKKLQEIINKFGPIKSMTLLKRRDSVGSKIITLENNLNFKSGHKDKITFVFIKRLNSPYELYDVSIN